jgi:cytochrome b pre-mRNA-processing protein 3
MNKKYIYIYNNLINFTRNKELYKFLSREDKFSDRLTLFLLHFAFFLKILKMRKIRLFYKKFMILTLDNLSLALEK